MLLQPLSQESWHTLEHQPEQSEEPQSKRQVSVHPLAHDDVVQLCGEAGRPEIRLQLEPHELEEI